MTPCHRDVIYAFLEYSTKTVEGRSEDGGFTQSVCAVRFAGNNDLLQEKGGLEHSQAMKNDRPRTYISV
jgi:hypothetical protein